MDLKLQETEGGKGKKIYHVGNQVQCSKEEIVLKHRARNQECFQGILPDRGLYDPVKPGS